MVTYEELFLFITMITNIISLALLISNNKKK